MAIQKHLTDPQPEIEYSSVWSVVLRLFWMVLGNIALVLCAAYVAKGTAPVATEIIFFVIAVGLIVARYVDIVWLKGETSEGKPATLANWRRYAATTAIVSTGLWALARVAAVHGWM